MLAMSDVSKSIRDGAGAGLLAGILFAVAQLAATVMAGDPAVLTFRRTASVLLGPAALATTPTATAIAVAVVAHLYLSTIYGVCYGIYNSALTRTTRRTAGRQAVIGAIYSGLLYLVNFQVFARALYPWLLALPQAAQLVLHVAGFGVPLGLLYATAEHHAQPGGLARLPRAIAHRSGTAHRPR